MCTVRLLGILLRHLSYVLPQGGLALTTNVALMVLALAQSPTCHLTTLTLLLPIAGQRENLIQRLRRWLATPTVDWERYDRPLASQFLQAWTGADIALVMDRTDLNNRFRVLCVGLATHHRAVLLAWEVLPYGSTSQDDQIALLQRLLPIMPTPARHRIILSGDAEFRAVERQKFCRQHGWHWHLGIKRDTCCDPGDGVWRPVRSLPIQKGERRFVNGIILTEKHAFGPVNLIIDWNANEDIPALGCWTNQRPAMPGAADANVSGLSRRTAI